jgi:flagellar export protein FliJ
MLAKQELAGAISRRSDSQENLRVADAQLEQTRGEQRSATAASTTIPAAEMLAHQAFLERVEAQRSSSAHDLKRHEAEVADRDATLTHAAGEHEMLKRLEERHRAEHEREVARREQSALDEMVGERFRGSAA